MPWRKVNLLLAVALLALFTLTACSRPPKYKWVSLSGNSIDSAISETQTAPQASVSPTPLVSPGTSGPGGPGFSLPPLRVAVAAVISPKETLKSYDELLNYLGEKLDRRIELVQRRTYAEINQLVQKGQVSLAFVCTRAYVDGRRNFGMELLAAPEIRGETGYRSYVIVPSQSAAQSLEDLRGKVFAFTDPLSFSGKLAPEYMLWERGEAPDSFFARHLYTYSHDNSIKAVAEKLVDGAAVDSAVYDYALALNPEYREKIKIIDRSVLVGNPPVVVPPGLDNQLKGRIKGILLSMYLDPKGKRILRNLMIDRFVEADDGSYDPIRIMMGKMGRTR